MDTRQIIESLFLEVMKDKGTPVAVVEPDRDLYENGYGLDSMDTATLSAMLSERFDDDPYAAGTFPRTLSQIVEFYAGRVVAG